jgi:hypothetical protein
MFKNLKRLGAAVVIAMLVVPHFALAATMSPSSASCSDNLGVCSLDSSEYNTVPAVIGNFIDGSTSTGNHIAGPEYPIVITLDLGSSVDVTQLDIHHKPSDGEGYGGEGNRIAPTSVHASNVVEYSSNGVDYYSFGTIPAYDNSTDLIAEVTGSATTRYLRVSNNENYWDAAGWFLTEFIVTYNSGGGAVPEMGVWALLVILPIMGYVVYQSTPKIRPTAV